jgi:hypothetical protein
MIYEPRLRTQYLIGLEEVSFHCVQPLRPDSAAIKATGITLNIFFAPSSNTQSDPFEVRRRTYGEKLW